MIDGVIHKHTLRFDEDTIPIGPSAVFLSAGVQGEDDIVVWYVENDEERPDPYTGGRQVRAINTGRGVFEDEKYIATVTTSNGVVWHVFEVTR